MKKLLAAAALVAVLFVGGYYAWTTFLNPVPPEQPSTQAQVVSPTAIVMPTIVTSALNRDGIPEKVSTLSLANSILGKDALNEFAALHGEGFDLVNGYRANYGDDKGRATLWVGQAKDANAAAQLAQEMAAKIGRGNPMFTDLKELNISNRTIYEVNGQGQLHFFYAINDKLVWLATDPAFAADGLHSIWGAVK